MELKTLIVEDRLEDAELMARELRRAGFVLDWRRAETKESYLAQLDSGLDVILADYSLPQFDAPLALRMLQERGYDIPFIVVTGTVSEEAAIECLRLGAADYLLKDRLVRLGPAVEHAIQAKKLRDGKRQAEIALKESEARFRRVAENARDVIYRYRLTAPEGFEYVSSAALAITGFEPESFYQNGSWWLDYIHEDDRRWLNDRRASLATSTTPFIIRFNRRDQLVWLEVHQAPISDSDGQVIAIEGIARDITEWVGAEEVLRESEEKFRAIFDGSQDVIIIADADGGKVMQLNPSCQHILGYSEESLLGRPISTLWPSEALLNWDKLVEELRREDAVLEAQNFVRADGTLCPMELTLTFIHWGKSRALLATFHDITEREQIKREINEKEKLYIALEKERELRELKDRFMSMVSHEFRTPLATIQTSSDLVKTYGDRMPPERRIGHLEKIQYQVKHLAGLIDDILIISRAEKFQLNFNPQPIALESFCSQLAEEIRQSAGKTHEIVISSTCHDTVISVDLLLFRQAISNLLSNALKYSPEAKTVHFDLACDPEKVVISVSDEGIGIPEEDQKRVFEVFHRAANVGAIAGTGLGLAVVKQAVEMHGGAVTFESQVNVGTKFTISLPRTLQGGD